MAAKYSVDNVQNTVYLGKNNQAINGYLVTVSFSEYDEQIQLKVPDIKPETVKAAIDTYLKNRVALAGLGKE